MKKTLSLFLAAAMILSSMVSVAAAETKTAKSAAGETATYYFLAPHNYVDTEKGAANENVGVWYWGGETGMPADSVWPGPSAEPAPEIGADVYKCTIPADAVGLIFNAGVDGGAAAHQTVDIDVEDAENDGMIYVLDNDFEHEEVMESGAVKTSGEWFSIDPEADNYYVNSDNYATYKYATYYFLAPDSYCDPENGAANSDVGIWHWGGDIGMPENSVWPGPVAAPAAEIGENVFKCKIPEDTTGLIFNAHVDAGDPADPELAKVAHQTKDITDVEDAEHAGMIYVLDNDNDKEVGENGATKTGGSWFSIDSSAENYYKNSDNYKTYDFVKGPEDEPGVETPDTATYYFYAPKSYCDTTRGAANENVGVWYWGGETGMPEDSVWPGPTATPAPEVGTNVFKCEIPIDATGLIFNAWVDAGDPADPELAAVAHQTKDINDVEDGEHDGMIYVLDCDNEEVGENGATKAGGDWFSIDPEAENYYQNSANYKTYNKATYYFLAPDSYCNVAAGAANENVGIWYWGGEIGMPEGSAWPGPIATPAPEVGYNVFKCKIPEDATGLIFNAWVDAGDPADPALAAVAHQTKDITDVEDAEHDGMIYVLDLDNQEIGENGAAKAGGAWFSIKPDTDNYYMNSDYYKTYNKNAPDTPDTPDSPDTPTIIVPDVSDTTTYKQGDEVTVSFLLGGIDNLASVNATLKYNSEILKLNDEFIESSVTADGSTVVINGKTSGVIEIGACFDPEKGTSNYSGEKAALITLKFTALKDFQKKDLNVESVLTYLLQIDSDSTKVVMNVNASTPVIVKDIYSALTLDVASNKTMMGDIDNDGEITSSDALEALRYSVGLAEFTDEQFRVADVNKDNIIDSEDSLFILRRSVGYTDEGTYFDD